MPTPSPINALTVAFDRPFNGLVTERPFASEYGAKEFGRLRETENLFCNEESGAIILRPNLEPTDMTGKYSADRKQYTGTLGDGKTKYAMYTDTARVWGEWEKRMVFGSPGVYVEHQKVVEETRDGAVVPMYWRVDTDKTFNANQGFTIWYSKYLLPNNWNNSIVIWLGNDIATQGVLLTIGKQETAGTTQVIKPSVQPQELLLEYRTHPVISGTPYPPPQPGQSLPASYAPQVQKKIFTLPQNYLPYSWGGDFNVLSLFVVDRFIVVAFNGLEKIVAFRCEGWGSEETDTLSQKYPLITPANSYLSIFGYGAAMLGFKKMVHAKEGTAWTPLVFPGEKITGGDAAANKKYVFSNTGISLVGGSGNSASVIVNGVEQGPVATEDSQRGVEAMVKLTGDPLSPTILPILSDAQLAALTTSQRRERDRKEYLARVTEKSPLLFRFKLFNPISRESATADHSDVSGTILSYSEKVAGAVTGEYNYGRSDLTISCYNYNPATLFGRKNALVGISLLPFGGTASSLRVIHCCRDTMIEQETRNKVRLMLQCQDVVARLKEHPIEDASSFDDKGWTDVQMMHYLIEDIGGVELVTVSGEPAYLLTGSGDSSKPTWQWDATTPVWNASQEVREFSCKLLFPTRDGKILYKVKPTSASVAVASINAGTDIVGRPVYRHPADVWKTRITVAGIAGANLKGSYQQGEALIGIAYNQELARALGSSPLKPIIKSQYTDWTTIERIVNDKWTLHCGSNTWITATMKAWEKFFALWVYDVFSWTDPRYMFMNGKYMLLGYDQSTKKFTNTAGIEAWKLD